MREDQDPYGVGSNVYDDYSQYSYGTPPPPKSSAPTAGAQPYQPAAGTSTRPIITPGMSGADILNATGTTGQPAGASSDGQPQAGTGAPGYVNVGDPMQAAIYRAFAAKGLQPRDQADFQYWVDRINQTGGWNNPDNQKYWLDRMAQSQGGVGDYAERPEAGAGGSYNSASGIGLFDPESQAKIKQAFLNRLGALSKPVTSEDPSVAGAISANKLLSQRALEEAKRGLAEQAYAKGTLNSAGYDQSQIQAGEKEGALEAAFAGNAVSQAQQQRDSLLNQLLGIGGSMTSGANQLQLGYDNLGYNYAALQNSMNKDAILAALGYFGG